MNTFRCICLLAAVHMTLQQIMRYVEDNDKSIITSKLFNEGPKDEYPTFTFCFADDPRIIYSEAVHELSISREDYKNFFKGRGSKPNKTFERILGVD